MILCELCAFLVCVCVGGGGAVLTMHGTNNVKYQA